ncbi:MAG: hypothetical protein ACHQT9_04655 [Candidatus Saccharimonadales bacterium]
MKKSHKKSKVSFLGRVHPGVFLGVAIISGIICIFGLRSNNEHMIVLRDAVFSADKNNGDINGALKNLQSYVTSHMNTNLSTGNGSVYPPIQLKYTYDRLVAAQTNSIHDQKTALYNQAQTYCQQLDPVDFSGRNRVPCIENYVQTHNVTAAAIPDSLYKFSFTSPTWSPDLAGWTMLIAIGSIILFAISLTYRYLK